MGRERDHDNAMTSKSTVQGLTAAIEAILAGVHKGAEYRRREAYDARAEEDRLRSQEDQEMQREFHKARMASQKPTLGERMQKSFGWLPDSARTHATTAFMETMNPQMAIAKLQAELEAIGADPGAFVAPAFGSPEFDPTKNYEEIGKARDQERKERKVSASEIRNAIAALQVFALEEQSGGGARQAIAAPESPEKTAHRQRMADMQKKLLALGTEDQNNPVVQKLTENSMKMSLPVNGTHTSAVQQLAGQGPRSGWQPPGIMDMEESSATRAAQSDDELLRNAPKYVPNRDPYAGGQPPWWQPPGQEYGPYTGPAGINLPSLAQQAELEAQQMGQPSIPFTMSGPEMIQAEQVLREFMEKVNRKRR